MLSPVYETFTTLLVTSQSLATQVIQPNVVGRFNAVEREMAGAFEGIYDGSEKEPDVLFYCVQPDSNKLYNAVIGNWLRRNLCRTC